MKPNRYAGWFLQKLGFESPKDRWERKAKHLDRVMEEFESEDNFPTINIYIEEVILEHGLHKENEQKNDNKTKRKA
jgi:hypothetical protein